MVETAIAADTARHAIENQVFFSGKFYFVFTILMFSAACAGSFISEFFRTRLKALAFKTGLTAAGPRLVTAPAGGEKDKSETAGEDWALKEFRTLRRFKLEELLTALFEIDFWLSRERDALIFKTPANTVPSPINTIHLIPSLYFPELEPAAMAVVDAYRNHLDWIASIQEQLQAAEKETDRTAVLVHYNRQYQENCQPLFRAIKSMEDKARSVMKNVIGMEF